MINDPIHDPRPRAVHQYGNFIEYDLGKMMTGDYYYDVCTSKFLVGLRRRFFPRTLRYETRYQPPIHLDPVKTPLWDMIPRTVANSSWVPLGALTQTATNVQEVPDED